MRRQFLLITLVCCSIAGIHAQSENNTIKLWKEQAARVTIVRDIWDIPHVFGKSDADAVFGMMYAQAEDDFKRVERNYIEVLGRKAEVFGEKFLFEDLRQRLFIDSVQAKYLYKKSPSWLKKLMNAWADGLNYYLYTHPEVKPELITSFQPWMPLMFSEGSIGGDISTISTAQLQTFYEDSPTESYLPEDNNSEQRGSNGIAIGAKKSASGNALLLINPHTTFYFRTEMHIVSEEGLNVYGSVTWGQFFVYQGFNEHCGWMHTSSSTDAIDHYLEEVSSEKPYTYRYGNKRKPVRTQSIELKYRKDSILLSRTFETYYTQHGPVTGKQDDLWISTNLMNSPLKALQQSWLRTKAKGFDSFEKVMKLRTNSSNNTVFADRNGNIAYWQGNFIPRRKGGINPGTILDGTNPDNDWKGIHKLSEIIQFKNPPKGWLQNCNSSPYFATGTPSDLKIKYPEYMGPDKQNFRALNAIRQLDSDTLISIEGLQSIAYNNKLPAFEALIPSLLEAIKVVATTDLPNHQLMKQAYSLFEQWDATWDSTSVATTLAIQWGERLKKYVIENTSGAKFKDDISLVQFMTDSISGVVKTRLLAETMRAINDKWGTWQVAWGDVNRFQRITGELSEDFNDNEPSSAVPFATGFWGSLAAFDTYKSFENKRNYGFGGNSFVAIVEFGPKITAYSVVPGGHSSDSLSVHFNDQTPLFCKLKTKPVFFYRDDIEKAKVKSYQPGIKD